MLCDTNPSMPEDCCEVKMEKSRAEQTVGQTLDEHIKSARAQVERLCIKKAKAEALNILDHPADFYAHLFYRH